MKLGYVGLGNMRGPLATRLQLSHPLTVYDLNPAAVAPLVDKGASVSPSLTALAETCDTILLCLPKSEHVRTAIFGDGGLGAALKPGTRIVDQTSGDPRQTRDMARLLTERGVTLVDAPVSGGPAAADAGTISIMVGASQEEYDYIAPLLETISTVVFRAGEVGAGHTMKLVNNLLSSAQRALTLECLALAAKNGIETGEAVQILLAGGGRNVFLEKGVSAIIETGDMGGGFTLELMHKDVDLACAIGSDSDMPMLFGAIAREMYRMAMQFEGKSSGINSVARAIEKLTGASLVASAKGKNPSNGRTL